MPALKERKGNSYQLKNKCPYCGRNNDSVASIENEKILPSPGDITICFKCGEFAEFNDDLTLKKVSIDSLDEEIANLAKRIKENLNNWKKMN